MNFVEKFIHTKVCAILYVHGTYALRNMYYEIFHKKFQKKKMFLFVIF